MKRLLLLTLIATLTFISAQSQYTNIDEHLEQALIDLGYDDVLDSYVLTSNIVNIKSLDLSSKNLRYASDLNKFPALESVNLSNNNIQYLNFNENVPNLELVIIDNNPLERAVLSKSSKLKVFSAVNGDRELLNYILSASYDFSFNPLLEELYLESESIIELDVSQNHKLHTLSVQNTKLTSLDLSNTPTIQNFTGQQNLNLGCIKVGNLDEVNTNANFSTDAYSPFAEDCSIYALNDRITGVQEITTNNGTLYYNDIQEGIAHWLNDPEKQDFTKYPFLLPGSQFIFYTEGNEIESVHFEINYSTIESRDQVQRKIVVVNEPPYKITYPNSENTRGEGSISIKATPYSRDNAEGIAGEIFETSAYILEDWREFEDILKIRNLNDDQVVYEVKEGQENTIDLRLAYGQTVYFDPEPKNGFSNTPITYDISGPNIDDSTNYFIFGKVMPYPNGLVLEEGRYTVDLDFYFSDGWLRPSRSKTFTFTITYPEETGKTFIPDDKFEQYLIDAGHDDMLDDFVLTENISSIEYVDLAFKRVEDLTGLEDFSALKHLGTNWCPIKAIDISQNKKLELLSIRGAWLTSIDLSNNTALKHLEITDSNISTLDLSANVELEVLIADQLGNLSLGYLSELDISKNNKLKKLNVENNRELRCIQVSESQLSNIPTGWSKDDAAEYSLNCAEKTYVPDDNFEQFLINEGYDDVLDDYVLTTNIKSVTIIDLYARRIGIKDLTGIQDFTLLKKLVNLGNPITSVDLSKNIWLEELVWNENEMKTLDLSNNTQLSVLKIWKVPLEALDLANNLKLSNLRLDDTAIETLDLSQHEKLIDLTIHDTNIASMNISKSTDLRSLEIWNTEIKTLDFSQNSQLNQIEIWSTPLEAIDFSQNSELYQIDIKKTQIESIDLSNNLELKELKIKNCFLEEIDLTANIKLLDITITDNNLTKIDLPESKYMYNIRLTNNFLNEIVIPETVGPLQLRLNQNNLKTVDVSNNPRLNVLVLNNNKLSSLDISNNTELVELDVTANSQLECIKINQSQLSNLTDIWLKDDGIEYSLDCGEPNEAARTYIPDDNFEQALIDLGYDDVLDDYVLTQVVEEITELYMERLGITDLTGLEDFKKLEYLYLSDNPITQIDVSNNSVLLEFSLTNTNITNLDVSNNPTIKEIFLSNTAISTIDFSNNKELLFIDVRGTDLKKLDLSYNSKLNALYIDDTQIKELNLSANTFIEYLHFNRTPISDINLTNNTQLYVLEVESTQLTSLNLANHLRLGILSATNNPNLACIQVSESQLSAIPSAWSKDDNTHYSLDCNSEPTNEESKTYIPDDNFEQYLIELGYDDVLDDYVLTNMVEQVIGLSIPNNSGITDLTGIQDFKLLRVFSMGSSPISSMDLSNNYSLTNLSLLSTEISTIDLSQNKQLKYLRIKNAPLESIDLSKNEELDLISIKDCSLEEIDLTANLKLLDLTITDNKLRSIDLPNRFMYNIRLSNNFLSEIVIPAMVGPVQLRLDNNNLKTVDVSNLPRLNVLLLDNNVLESLDVSNNLDLVELNVASNSHLECIQINESQLSAIPSAWSKDDNTHYSLDCNSEPTNEESKTYIPDENFEQVLIDLGYDDVLDGTVLTSNIETITELVLFSKGIQDLTGLEDFVALKSLDVADNPITQIDVSALTALEILLLGNTAVSTLDVSNNGLLRILDANGTQISTLDVSQNPNLERLEIADGSIGAIDVSANPVLENLNVFNTAITNLDLANNPLLKTLNISSTQLISVDLSNTSELSTLMATNNPQLVCIQLNENQLNAIPASWTKDDFAQYTLDCTGSDLDTDNDGIADSVDLCSDTPENIPVDASGCPSQSTIADLVIENIKITAGSDPCTNNSGYVTIEVLKNVPLNVSISTSASSVFDGVLSAETPIVLTDLSEDNYTITVSNPSILDATFIWNVSFTEESNSVSVEVAATQPNLVYTLGVSGSKNYQVTVNGSTTDFDFKNIGLEELEIPLVVGVNAITVSGTLDCNAPEDGGKSDNLLLFPTLSDGMITIDNNQEHQIKDISIRSLNGVSAKYMAINDNPKKIEIDARGTSTGMYIVRIELASGQVELMKILLR